MAVKILRMRPRPGGDEEPCWDERGYQLGDPRRGAEWHHVKNAIFVKTLEKAADLTEQKKFAIRMGRKGLRPSLVQPSSLRIIR